MLADWAAGARAWGPAPVAFATDEMVVLRVLIDGAAGTTWKIVPAPLKYQAIYLHRSGRQNPRRGSAASGFRGRGYSLLCQRNRAGDGENGGSHHDQDEKLHFQVQG